MSMIPLQIQHSQLIPTKVRFGKVPFHTHQPYILLFPISVERKMYDHFKKKLLFWV